jgi:YVTN family beta-propeller protein
VLKRISLLLVCLNASAWLFAQIPSPALLVLNKSDRTLAVVNPSTLEVVARVATGEDPHEAEASPDGKLAFASDYGGPQGDLHMISVIDLADLKPLPPIDLGALRAAHGLEFAGGKLYFTAEGSKAIGSYDPASGRIDWVMGTGQDRTHMVKVSRDGRQIYTSNVSSDTISIFDRTSQNGWEQTLVPVGKGPEGFDVSPDGKELWAANSHDGTISVIDIASKKVVQTLNIPTKMANRLKFTPDGKRVLISDLRSGDLVVVDAGSKKEIKRLKVGSGAAGILVQPDGSRAFVAASPDNQVAVIDLKTLEISGRISPGKEPDGMAWVSGRK